MDEQKKTNENALNTLNAIETNGDVLIQSASKINESVEALEPILDVIAQNTVKEKGPIEVTINGVQVITLKGDPGKDGADGHTPTNDELKEIIKPMIPAPIKGDKGDDGKTPEKGVDYYTEEEIEQLKAVLKDFIAAQLPDDEEIDEKVKSALPKAKKTLTIAQVVQKLNALENSLDWKVLKNVPEYFRTGGRGGGTQGVDVIYNDRVITSALKSITFTGSGVSVSQTSDGAVVVTVTGGGSGSYEILETTTIPTDSELVFPFSEEPKEVVINGASYTALGGGYTWTWDGANVTLNQPVGDGGRIYARK